jgi:hypothetical protein
MNGIFRTMPAIALIGADRSIPSLLGGELEQALPGGPSLPATLSAQSDMLVATGRKSNLKAGNRS